MSTSTRFLFLLVLAWTLPLRASACNVPVFRYALERWPSDRYHALVFHKGPLSAAEQAQVTEMRKPGANLHVETVDTAHPLNEEHDRIWREQVKPMQPWLVLHYPVSEETGQPVWSGQLDRFRTVVDSPARREIARRLMGGEAVVWVLLESGDRKQDDAVARLLGEELPKLEKSLRLPEGIGTDVQLLSRLPVKIAFSVLRVARTDTAEGPFVAMLLHSDPDFPPARGPIVFPVFGRGRSFDGLLGKGINPATLRDTAQRLIGACSCEIKRQNPGTDLLLAADWDSLLDLREAGDAAPALSGNWESEPSTASVSDDPKTPSHRSLLILGVTVAGLMTVLTGIWVWRTHSPSTGAPST